jgi:hypothetical protein
VSDPLPVAGSVYSFRTAPYSEFAPQSTGRYAALKVLGVNEVLVVVGVLDSISRMPPSLEDVRDCRILCEHRFAHNGRPAVFGLNVEWWTSSALDEMTLLGEVPPTQEQLEFSSRIFNLAGGTVLATIHAANDAAEGEWRWDNDREALVAEQQRIDAAQAAKKAAQEERYRNRLRGLTWEKLLEETPFERWSSSPPFPPPDFTLQARAVIHHTCRALRQLGAKPRKAAVRKLMKECVEWFNTADERAGGVIETEEREDICAVLDEIAHVAQQDSLMDEIDGWRTW